MFLESPFIWRSWTGLHASITTGRPAFEHVHGERYFDHLARTPEDAQLFHAFAAGSSRQAIPAVLAAYDFSPFTRIIDVGGGQGSLVRGILESYPRLTGVLFDLPGVVAGAQELQDSPAAQRCEIAGGDMFQSVPERGDAYVLRANLPDWSDDEAVQILRNCRRAMSEHGRLLVIEFVSAPPGEADFAKWLDLMMLVLLTGRERTESEFRKLFAAAGFRLNRIIPTDAEAIIEGVAA
jgi:hypothetical protein